MFGRKAGLFLFLFSLGLASLAGVRDFAVKQYGLDQDFEGIFIYSIVQDENGFLWIGSDDGLYRFDGKSMQNFNKKDSTIGGLVTASVIADDGHLYLGYYEGGVSIVEHGKYRKLISGDELPNKVTRLYHDKDGVIWGLTANSGLIQIKDGVAKHIQIDILSEMIAYDLIRHEDRFYIATNEGVLTLDYQEDESFQANGFVDNSYGKTINALYEDPDKDHVLWIGADEGLFFLDHNSDGLEKLAPVRGVEHLRVTAIARDQLETIWVGTAESGLIEIELRDDHAYRITKFDRDRSFPSNQINSLYVDKENEIWVGTFGSGLVQLNRAYFHHYELQKTAKIQGVNDIYQVDENLYYLGTNTGLVKAFNQIGKDSLTFQIVKGTENLEITRIQLQKDILWMGTSNKGLIRYDLKNGKQKKIELNPVDPGLTHLVRYLVLGQKGSLWVSIAGNGVYNIDFNGKLITHYNTRNGFYHNEIFSILLDNAGNIWFGAQGVGLALLKEGSHPEYLTRDGVFPARDINSISQDDNGKIWIATAGQGLYSFDGEEFERFDESTGLISNFCNAVEVDNAGNVWVGHRKGLSLIQQEYGLVRKFNHPSELGETESVMNSVLKDLDGNIWFGNPYGVTKVILPHIQHQIKERETHIQDLQLFFENVDLLAFSEQKKLDNLLPQDLTFEYTDNHITFDFISINLRNPEAIHYKYQLEGLDKVWSPVNTNNIATFTNLDPGNYTFKVKESDHKQLWKDEYASISFKINLPYWKEWWFYLLQLAFVMLIMTLTYLASSRIENTFIIRLMVYVSVFIIFEYIHTELEPLIDSIAGETPIFQVGINLVLALALLPIELRLAKYLKHKKALQDKVAEAMSKT